MSSNEFIAGLTAAVINTTALFPINKLIFRQMAGGHRAQYAADQMKEEGFRYLYRGILPPLIQKMASVSLMFGTFTHYKKLTDSKFTDSPYIVNLTIAACLTGTTEAILTPLERVQMLLQDRKFHKNYRNTLDALIKLRKFGATEYYRGLTCVLLRNGPSNIFFFGLRDKIKELLHQASQNRKLMKDNTNLSQIIARSDGSSDSPIVDKARRLEAMGTLLTELQTDHSPIKREIILVKSEQSSMLHDFLSGAILGMFISTLFYPLSVIRTRMQTRAPGTEFLSMAQAFKAIYSERDRKFSRLFHGCLINVMRQFISWGIINCSYEFVLRQLDKTN